MSARLQYGPTAKVLHWSVVSLLLIQYLIGWLMPDIHGGMSPGVPMTFHISIGMAILVIMTFRFAWRLMHPVAPESSLPAYQRLSSEAVHWLLYVVVLLTTLSGWVFASARGWRIDWFYLFRLSMLTSQNPNLLKAIDGLHQLLEWSLLILIGVHVAAAFLHVYYYRDGVMRRIFPKDW
jgi:cytochrome b561